MTWLLVILHIVGTDVTAQTLSTHKDMVACFKAREEIKWPGMRGPELICIRAEAVPPQPGPPR